MSINPFEAINQRLSSIEELLLEIKHKPVEAESKENLTVKEVSELLGVTTQTVHNYIKKGQITASKVGRILLVRKADLDKSLTEVKSLRYKRK